MNRLQSIPKGWLFLLIVILLYGVVALLEPSAARRAVGGSASIARQVLPVFGLVLALMLVFHGLIKPKQVTRHLGQEAGLAGWAVAVVGGLLSMGPIYMWFPLLADLRSQGMRNALVATFLYNRAIKLPLLPFLVHYFGWGFVVVLTAYMLIFSVLNGLIVERFVGTRPDT